MAAFTLADVEAAIRAGWALDTCDEIDRADWTPVNPARGQCGATTLVLHDLFGGQIATAEVWDNDRRQGMHHWLRTNAGLDLDLAREQFSATEVVGEPVLRTRPVRRPNRGAEQYERLRSRVFAALDLNGALQSGERAESLA